MNEQLKQLQDKVKNLRERANNLDVSIYKICKLAENKYGKKFTKRRAYRVLSGDTNGERSIKHLNLLEKVIKELENELTRNTK